MASNIISTSHGCLRPCDGLVAHSFQHHLVPKPRRSSQKKISGDVSLLIKGSPDETSRSTAFRLPVWIREAGESCNVDEEEEDGVEPQVASSQRGSCAAVGRDGRFKFNLDEYMVTIDRPFGMNFAETENGGVFVESLARQVCRNQE